jgi:hypothetical protein
MEMVDARVCTRLIRSGNPWRCDEAGTRVTATAIYFYTRVRSARGGTVTHRWLRDGTVVAEARLRIRANPEEGYRTFSRQTVSRPGSWQVVAVDGDGRVIDERRFEVPAPPSRRR